jgi:phenylpropionate dioxygenase-like ring-hydroxylating dioxygenase large terminal subunit
MGPRPLRRLAPMTDPEQWTPLIASQAVTTGPQRVLLADVPLVVWRTARGRPVVFVDRCPHHGLALSTGRRTFTGRLVCDGHGWEFDATGTCRRAPGRSLSEVAGRHASVVPCRVADGRLWVLTGADGVPIAR